MARYKLLLVDDEVDVRESMARTVDWEECGFSLCGCAAGALEAMEMAKTLLPDVVMTDICMPYMDGLELIERLKAMYPAMQFVVVSGYDDFAYARRALEYQVMDYLLKPLSAQGVRDALGKILARLDAETARRLDIAGFQEQAARDRAQMERMALMEMLLERTQESGLLAGVETAQFFPAHLALMEVERTADNERVLQRDFKGRRDLMYFALQEMAMELMAQDAQGPCVCHRGRLALLPRCGQEQAVRLMERLMDTVRMYLHLQVRSAVSAPVRAPEELAALYQRTLLLVGSSATFAQGSLFLMAEQPLLGDAPALYADLPGEMAQLLRAGDEGRIEAYFANLQAELQQHGASPALLRALGAMAHSALLTTALRAGIEPETALTLLDRHKLMPPLEVGDALRTLCAAAKEASGLIAERNRADSKEFAQRIAEHIRQRYCDPQLSITEVCEAFHISQTQLSLIFKREMGTSFLQYVLDLRIARAQALLRDTDRKIYEIALETGFEDPGYFSYCFKQRCGLTPKNYRASGGEC